MTGKPARFDPETATAVLDWGRGVWTYQNTWYWGSASGYVDGVPFGMNLGYGFGDTRAATENMLLYDGVAHKLDQVDFGIPKDAAGKDDLLGALARNGQPGPPGSDLYAHSGTALLTRARWCWKAISIRCLVASTARPCWMMGRR